MRVRDRAVAVLAALLPQDLETWFAEMEALRDEARASRRPGRHNPVERTILPGRKEGP